VLSTVRRGAVGVVVLVVLVCVAVPATSARATGRAGGCADSGATLSCGSGVGGSPGNQGPSRGGPGASGGAGGVVQRHCPDYVPYSVAIPGGMGGPAPAGAVQPGGWYVDLCSVGNAQSIAQGLQWFATGQAPTVAPPDPATVGAQAASELQLPTPSLALSPVTTGYVNLAEWLSVTPSIWHLFTTTAQACNAGGCTTATATATPAIVTWNTGDGSVVACNGPGTAYNPDLSASEQSTACSHTYATTSAGQPDSGGNPNDGAFTVTASVTWTVSWSGPDGSAGVLPSLITEASTSLKVTQIESVND
jgi:hypothetical protein